MSGKPLIHRESFTVRSFEIDLTHRLKIEVMCSLFQEVASHHAQQLGVGYTHLQQKNIFWVLSRLLVKINRLPTWHDTIVISTWPKGLNRLFAIRDFELSDEAGEVLCQATSYWLMVDAATRRPVRPDHFLEQLLVPDKQALTETIDKIELPQLEEEIYAVRVRYTDLDHNWHVNNVQYIHWVLDCFAPQQYEQHPLQSLQINFLAESRFQDTIKLYSTPSSEAPGVFLIAGKKEDSSLSFSAKAGFRV